MAFDRSSAMLGIASSFNHIGYNEQVVYFRPYLLTAHNITHLITLIILTLEALNFL